MMKVEKIDKAINALAELIENYTDSVPAEKINALAALIEARASVSEIINLPK